jgi:hypothetical protein
MFRAPTGAGLPPFATMLQDIHATTRQTAIHLGISEATLKKYAKTGNAPRSVQLALFWETRWGRSAADTEAANWGAMYYREATMARRELDRMASIIARLELEISQGSGSRPANLPIFRIR